MRSIFLVVNGEPQGKGRPRFSTKNGYPKAYTPKKTEDYEQLIRSEYLKLKAKNEDVEFFEKGVPIRININVFFGIPKNTPKWKREIMLFKKIFPTKKPDIDNIMKVVCDALNGVAYHDDAQIVECYCVKYYSNEPKLKIYIEKVGDNV